MVKFVPRMSAESDTVIVVFALLGVYLKYDSVVLLMEAGVLLNGTTVSEVAVCQSL